MGCRLGMGYGGMQAGRKLGWKGGRLVLVGGRQAGRKLGWEGAG